MNSCEKFRHHLLKHGRQSVLRHEQLGEHSRECKACQRLLHSWTRIPGLLDELPDREPADSLLRRTRHAVVQSVTSPPVESRRVPRLATSLASAAVLLAAIGLSRQLFDNEYPPLIVPASKEEFESTYGQPLEAPRRSGERSDKPLGADPVDSYVSGQQAGEAPASLREGDLVLDRAGADRIEESAVRISQLKKNRPVEESLSDANRGLASGPANAGDNLARVMQKDQRLPAKPVAEFGAERGTVREGRERQLGAKLDADGWSSAHGDDLRGSFADEGKLGQVLSLSEAVDNESPDESFYRDEISQIHRDIDHESAKSTVSADKKFKNNEPVPQIISNAELAAAVGGGFNFRGYYEASEALHFQAAQGYWANTHVPGDPAIRLLKARLGAWDRSGQLMRLEQDVRPVSQPFDAPADNALALSLMSDANAVEGATRMRLQVGIRGIEHRRGQRPAMNVGVVIDLPSDADDATRIAARALLDAVLASKQPGDRFSLVINGPDGLVVRPEDFRFGPLQLARQAIAGIDQAESSAGRKLAQSIAEASKLVRQTDDPSLPLGSSSILLVSANSLDNIEQLSAQVHAQATDGITLSVVPLGNLPGSSQVEQLVLAGLGNRRILESPDQARQLIDAELHSSSRAVARAARLSIRLAAGVRLIDVVGSERLDEQRSQRVRDIENSMDRRLSANLGIQADRGEDEGGIQIVIPSIFSGDDVTVLLDLLVSQPGEIASVSLRYKDLVYLSNGNLRGQLSLPAGALDRGPAQYTVTRNLLAHHFSAAASQAADALGRQQVSDAVAVLTKMRDEIVDLRSRIPAFKNDRELLRDQQILERYIEVLGSPGAHEPELADSLRYAAWAKTHRPLAEWK